jgi:hypothetical protein
MHAQKQIKLLECCDLDKFYCNFLGYRLTDFAGSPHVQGAGGGSDPTTERLSNLREAVR